MLEKKNNGNELKISERIDVNKNQALNSMWDGKNMKGEIL